MGLECSGKFLRRRRRPCVMFVRQFLKQVDIFSRILFESYVEPVAKRVFVLTYFKSKMGPFFSGNTGVELENTTRVKRLRFGCESPVVEETMKDRRSTYEHFPVDRPEVPYEVDF